MYSGLTFTHDAAYWSSWLKEKIRPTPDTMHYLLTHFSWLWWIVNNVGFIRDPLMRVVYHCELRQSTNFRFKLRGD